MTVKDKVYGSVNISDPILVEIIKTDVFQRLKKIAQFGLPDEYYNFKGYSRFEHSVGVMILLRKLGASLEEQTAGLLHDVSHTAFSHTVDWVIGTEGKEDFQDKRHSKYAKDPELSIIFEKYGYNPKRILSLDKFKLLDRELPDLCADRIDYALRELPKNVIKSTLPYLKVIDNNIVFSAKKPAQIFANNFIKLQMTHWGGFESTSRWYILADLLKRALKSNIIIFEDFYKDDTYVINKIKKAKNPELNKFLKILRNKSLSYLPKSNQVQHKKFRYVDPLFLEKDKIVRLSKADLKFKKLITQARLENSNGIILPQID